MVGLSWHTFDMLMLLIDLVTDLLISECADLGVYRQSVVVTINNVILLSFSFLIPYFLP